MYYPSYRDNYALMGVKLYKKKPAGGLPLRPFIPRYPTGLIRPVYIRR